MQFAGTLESPSPRERVLAFLTDPQAAGQCVPDVERIDVTDATHFRAVERADLGPLRGKFTFDMTWQELTAPEHARMTAQG